MGRNDFLVGISSYLYFYIFGTIVLCHYSTSMNTVYPRIVSAETILFWIWPYALWPLATVHKSAETIEGRKQFKGGNYSRKYGTSVESGKQKKNYTEFTLFHFKALF